MVGKEPPRPPSKGPPNFEDLKKQHHHTILTQGKRRNRIKAILGKNFVGLRQCGGEIDILTKDEIPPGVRERIEKIWRRDE